MELRLLKQFKISLVFSFLQNAFKRTKKDSKVNINQQNKNKGTKNNKYNNFLGTQTSKRVKVTCLVFRCFFVRLKPFRK